MSKPRQLRPSKRTAALNALGEIRDYLRELHRSNSEVAVQEFELVLLLHDVNIVAEALGCTAFVAIPATTGCWPLPAAVDANPNIAQQIGEENESVQGQ